MATELFQVPPGGVRSEPIGRDNPLCVRLLEEPITDEGLPPVAGRSVLRIVRVPGIVTGAAYQDADVMGTLIEFPNVFRAERKSGLCVTGFCYDFDDEGLQVDLHLFARNPGSPGADNAAFNLSDDGQWAWRGCLSFTSFFNFGANQMSQVTSAGLHLFSDSTSVFGYAVARGVQNIAADNIPAFGLAVMPD